MTENERMTLDEAIVHAREVAKNKYKEGMLCHANPDDGLLDGCIECAKEHEQLAEWLEELEAYRAIGTIEEFKALKEKNEPKKPILNNPKINEFYIKEAKLCPACHSYINNYSGNYCRDCGQKLDLANEGSRYERN